MASSSLISSLVAPRVPLLCRNCIKCSLNVNRRHTNNLSRRTAFLAVAVSTLSECNLALAFEFRMTVPDQTVEEAESVIMDHARALLGVKTLIESENWREMQQDLRKKSALLKQDIYTIIQNKPGTTRSLLRKLYFDLFNNVTKLDYAAREKDVARVQEYYRNISNALTDILSRI